MAICVAIFSLFAIGELVADKLPGIPGRNTAVSLIIRFLSGGFCGLVLAIAGHAPLLWHFFWAGLAGWQADWADIMSGAISSGHSNFRTSQLH